MYRALVVEDDPISQAALAKVLQKEGFTATVAATLREAREKYTAERPHLVLSDIKLPDGSSLDFIRTLDKEPDSQFVLITGHASIDTAVEALRLGVMDYMLKPLDLPRLKAILTNFTRSRELREEIGDLRKELKRLGHFGTLLGASKTMEKAYDLMGRVAPTDATVLLSGESGTGKDLAAQTIHSLSRRKKAVYLPLNCGAMSPTLIESELFGHEKGSFTGADRLHKGYFERASGGTLFLDEISEMPVELQVKLLRVLETNTIARIGGDAIIPVDVRVIAATNRKLDEAVANGKFREDLLYRLKVFPIDMPPLRERNGDIDLLAEHFLQKLNRAEAAQRKFTKPALKRLRDHSWPGNVRELKNVVHRAFILAEEDIGPECVVFGTEYADPDSLPVLKFKVGTTLEEVEKRVILATYDRCSGDKKEAAELLGMSLRTLYYRLHQYGAD